MRSLRLILLLLVAASAAAEPDRAGIVAGAERRTRADSMAAAAAPTKFSLNFYCDVSFRVRSNKRIVGWRYIGNHCNCES